MRGHQSLHDIFRHELNLLASIVRRFHKPDVLMHLAKHQGYHDLFEALQATPETPEDKEPSQRLERKP